MCWKSYTFIIKIKVFSLFLFCLQLFSFAEFFVIECSLSLSLYFSDFLFVYSCFDYISEYFFFCKKIFNFFYTLILFWIAKSTFIHCLIIFHSFFFIIIIQTISVVFNHFNRIAVFFLFVCLKINYRNWLSQMKKSESLSFSNKKKYSYRAKTTNNIDDDDNDIDIDLGFFCSENSVQSLLWLTLNSWYIINIIISSRWSEHTHTHTNDLSKMKIMKKRENIYRFIISNVKVIFLFSFLPFILGTYILHSIQ